MLGIDLLELVSMLYVHYIPTIQPHDGPQLTTCLSNHTEWSQFRVAFLECPGEHVEIRSQLRNFLKTGQSILLLHVCLLQKFLPSLRIFEMRIYILLID